MRRFQVGTLAALAVILVGAGAAAGTGRSPTLRVVVRGQGQVTCGTRCSGAHRRGRVLRLNTTPDAHYEFDRWSGVCIGVVPTCPVAMDRNTFVRAAFVGEPTEVVISVGGPGGVTSIPPGLDCGNRGYTCMSEVPFASSLTLVPTPGSTGRFAGWDGPCASAGSGSCMVQVKSSPTTTAAAFGHSTPLPGEQPLEVTRDDPQAHVTSQPAAIDCPPTCTASFDSGTVVTLHRDAGMWGSSCTGDALDRCAVVVDAPTVVDVIPPAPPPEVRPPEELIKVTTSGPGLVTSSDGGIRCGRSRVAEVRCSDRFSRVKTTVRLRSAARSGARFRGWGKACRGAAAVCTLRPPAGRELDATALFRRR